MSFTATIHPEIHNEFHFAEGTEVQSSCCFACWHSKPKSPVEFTVNKNDELKPQFKECDHRKRIIANQRLGRIVKGKFSDDPIANNDAFERLKMKLNDSMDKADPITSEKLERIVNAIYELKRELSDSNE